MRRVGSAAASVGAAVAAYERGATILRVHDVREHVEALRAVAARGRARMKIELRGLELFGHHGVLEEEREHGQTFLYDVELEVGERGATDRIEDAVDYREVATRCARSPTRRFELLEALASAVAETLVVRFARRARRRCASASARRACPSSSPPSRPSVPEEFR